jgi:hypothetical protein
VDTCDKQITTRPVCTMRDRRAPDADRDAFPAGPPVRTAARKLAQPPRAIRQPFRSRLSVSQSCQPSIKPVALLPSTRSYALTAGRMHNQTAVSLMQIAVSIDRAKLRTFANLPPTVEYTARRVARSNVPQTAGYYSAARRASCLIAIYKPLPRGAEAILFRRLWPRDSSPSLPPPPVTFIMPAYYRR